MKRFKGITAFCVVMATILVFFPSMCPGRPVLGRSTRRRALSTPRRFPYPGKFLEKYGYLPKLPPRVRHNIREIHAAIGHFQRLAGLNVTLRMNSATQRKMVSPRCGNKDLVPRLNVPPGGGSENQTGFYSPGTKWNISELTWRLVNYSPDMDANSQRQAINAAFRYWREVAPLDVREVGDEKADIEILFGGREHGDGPENAFDGQGRVIAHAFYPGDGRSHFDEAETWSTSGNSSSISLQVAAAHLFGHVLGLGHSAVRDALMNPYFLEVKDGNLSSTLLHDDDVNAIQLLYGGRDHLTTDPPETTQPVTESTELETASSVSTESPATTTESLPQGLDPCAVRFDALLQGPDAHLYVFRGDVIWRLSDWGVLPGYPRDVTEVYEHAPTNIGAAVYSWKTRYTYLFKGKTVFKYFGFHLVDRVRMLQREYPSGPQAAFMSYDGRIFLLQGSRYWRFNEKSMKVVGQADSAIYRWPGLPDNIEAAERLADGHLYVFKGAGYRRYDEFGRGVRPGYPRPKAPPFMGPVCGGKFVPK